MADKIPKRVEEYQKSDGTWSPRRREAAIIVEPALIIAAFDLATGKGLTADQLAGSSSPTAQFAGVEHSSLNVRYFVGTAQHEANFAVNERDTETSGFQTWGVYQISEEEARAVGLKSANLLNLLEATQVMIRLAERNRRAVREAAGILTTQPDPDDLPAYVALAHNQGNGAVRKTIYSHGVDWAGYKRRNPLIRIVSSGYGDDAISGGAKFPK